MRIYRRVSRPKAITFDLDDTLYDNLPCMRRAESELINYLQTHVTAVAQKDMSFWREIKRDWLIKRPELMSDMGQLRLLTLKSGLLACGLDEQTARLRADDAFEYFYYVRSDFSVSADIKNVLENLASKVPLAAITNGNVNLKQIEIAGYFREVFKSSLTQPMKPHPMMFHRAAGKMGVYPKDILHVGDNLEKDVFGAVNAGCESAWFAINRTMDLKREEVQVLPHVQLDCLSELTFLV